VPENPKNRRLNTMRGVRKGLADVIRGLESEEIDPDRGRALTAAYKALGEAIGGVALEKRIEALEGKRGPLTDREERQAH
jgi:hypothetical protein